MQKQVTAISRTPVWLLPTTVLIRLAARSALGSVFDIRPAVESDRDAIWEIFHAVVARGDTYSFDPQISRDEALAYWFQDKTHTYVLEEGGRILGTYILRSNQPGAGAHVANAAFMVAPS